MDSARYVAVGARLEDPETAALLGLAAGCGLPVRVGLLDDAPSSGGHPALAWHRLRPARPSLSGRLRRMARGRQAREADALASALTGDPWTAEVTAALPGEAPVSLVAIDGAGLEALRRWRDASGNDVPVTGWPEAADRLARETSAARRSTTGAPPSARPVGNVGAMHRVAVVPAPGAAGADAERVAGTLRRFRSRVVVSEPDEIPANTDVVVLLGLGRVVAHLPGLAADVRVVHLPVPADGASPWRHLLDGREIVRGGQDAPAGSEDELADLVLGRDTAALVRATREGDDAAALALLEAALAEAVPLDPCLRREMAYVARVTGSLTLEGRLLDAVAADRDDPDLDLEAARRRVADRLRETDPDWLPALPRSSPDPVPGRVLHVLKTTLPRRQAGYSVRGHHSLRALVEKDVDVVAVAAPERLDEGTSGPTALTETVLDGVRYLTPAPVVAEPGTAYLEAAAAALLEVVLRERPALLHVHSGHRGYDLGVVGAALATATGLPWVYELRGLFESLWTSDQRRAERGETYARRLEREADLARSAGVAVTLAGTMKADLVARGVPEDHVVVVPNAVDPDALRPTPRDVELQRRVGTEGRFTFGYVSNLDHAREQVEDLVRAAVVLRSRGRAVRCLVVGTGTREEQLKELTRTLGADDVVTFTGKVPHDRVSDYYALLDVLVVPRSDERAARLVTPLKPFEAMAMGVPVVVSAQPALLEVVGGGERGWSYPSGDAEELADLLDRLAEAPAERRTVAERARRWVTRERTWARNADRYREIYARLTGAPPDAAAR